LLKSRDLAKKARKTLFKIDLDKTIQGSVHPKAMKTEFLYSPFVASHGANV